MPRTKKTAEEGSEMAASTTASGRFSQEDGVVYDPNGQVLRTYTEEDHGETYVELATEFAEKQNVKRGL